MSAQELLDEGLKLHRAGAFAAAEPLYREVLGRQPDNAKALHLMGVLALQTGRTDQAVSSIGRAIAIQPDFPEAHNNLGNAFKVMGRADEAIAAYRQAIAWRQDFPEAHYNLGLLLRAQGRRDDAIAAFRHAIAARPDHAEALAHLGIALTESQRLEEATTVLRAALALTPQHVLAAVSLGIALCQLERGEEALPVLEGAVRAAPGFAPAHGNLGLALMKLGRLDEAVACQRAAIGLQPDYALAHSNLGNALKAAGRPDEALVAYGEALRLRPDFAECHINLGITLTESGRPQDATAALETAIRLCPDLARGHTALGSALQALWRLDEAMAAHRRALDLSPDLPNALINLGTVLQLLGRPTDAAACYDRVIDRHPEHELAFGNLLNCTIYRDDLDNDAIAEVHRRYGRAFPSEILAGPPMAKPDPADADRRLRIGYLSSDLRNHPVASNLIPIIERHDRAGFEIHFYAHVLKPDRYTDEFRALADGWHDIIGLSDRQAAERIRADGIDILVSLAGRFDLNRPGICRYRAAPVQIATHDVATSGLAEMDYILGDGTLLARPATEWFSERRLRLPRFPIADLPVGLPPVPAVPRHGPAVFGCFNNPAKIAPTVTAIWGAVLAALPEARLVLKYHQAYGSPLLRSRLLGELTQAGAAAAQVEFIADKDDYGRFLARYEAVDIALDTQPFSGSTTSFQALAMGVPVVTLMGDRMAGRWTASMLRAVRLPQLIAADRDGYAAVAVAAARSVDAWRSRRSEIRDRLRSSSLCDTAAWTRRLERLYRAVWRRRCGQD